MWCAYDLPSLHLSLVNITDYPGYLSCTGNLAFASVFQCLKGSFGSLQNVSSNAVDPSNGSPVGKGSPRRPLQHPVTLLQPSASYQGCFSAGGFNWVRSQPSSPSGYGRSEIALYMCLLLLCSADCRQMHLSEISLCPQSISCLVPSTAYSCVASDSWQN